MKYVHAFVVAFQGLWMVAFAYVGAWQWALWCAVFGGYSMWHLRKGKASGKG